MHFFILVMTGTMTAKLEYVPKSNMSNKFFVLAGLLAILCTVEVVRRLRKNQEIKFHILLTTATSTLLLIAGIALNFMNK